MGLIFTGLTYGSVTHAQDAAPTAVIAKFHGTLDR